MRQLLFVININNTRKQQQPQQTAFLVAEVKCLEHLQVYDQHLPEGELRG
jgi:hypothetical protein